jgi:hypothetical protein
MSSSRDLEYSKLSAQEELGEDDEVILNFNSSAVVTPADDESKDYSPVIRNEYPFPISRPPSKQRDWVYGIVFILQFLAILIISLIEQVYLKHSAMGYNRAESWASIVMIITLVGGAIGGSTCILLIGYDLRAGLLQLSLIFSFILKILMGNIIWLMHSKFSFLGVIMIVSALWDGIRYRSASAGITFSSTLIKLISQLSKSYGIWLAVIVAGIVATQTLVLLWWGAFFMGLISTIPSELVVITAMGMLFSLYWVAQFFQVMLSFIVGGCILWLFIKEDDDHQQGISMNIIPKFSLSSLPIQSTNSSLMMDDSNDSSIDEDHLSHEEEVDQQLVRKLGLYLQCALTASFGSICKGALMMSPAQFVLSCRYLVLQQTSPTSSSSSSSRLSCCIKSILKALDCSLRGVYPLARRYHRLSLCLIAVYGRTLARTAEDQLQYHPETLNSSLEETTSFTLECVAACIAAVTSIVFGLFAEERGHESWPLFIFTCFWLAYSGASLALSAYSSAIDALIVAAALNPSKLAKENQIVLLRFVRTAESSEPL